MKNDIQDKQYLALELTKIERGGSNVSSKEDVYSCYEYFLRKLTKTFDELSTVFELKNEIDKLQKENERLKTDNRVMLKPLIKDITEIINNGRGDMEFYIYDAILNICRRYEK